ncbi:MAG: hypothetical protein FWC70_11340 [Defluviitaleaceae bacterium]|nr:hypothetical protein [Defluviitaleaceae bacterium]
MTAWHVILMVIVTAPLIMLAISMIPVRYSVKASNADGTAITLRVSWLLRFLQYTYEVRDGKHFADFRILFFHIRPASAKTPRKKRRKRSNRVPPERKKTAPKPSEPETSFVDKLLGAHSFLTDEKGKIIIKHGVSMLKGLWRRVRPRYFDASGVIGLGCPFNTAMVLGAYESLAGMFDIRKNVRFAGDFNADDAFIRYTAELRGRIIAPGMMIPLVRFALRKPVRNLLITLLKN